MTSATDNRTTELLPCPICGKKVSIARTENEVGERWWFITRGTYRTTRCNCRLFLESEKFTGGWNDDYSRECRAKLIDKWNTRVTHGTLTAEQVEKATYAHSIHADCADADWQAIADELNAEMGSEREKALEELVRDMYEDWAYSIDGYYWGMLANYRKRMAELGVVDEC